jgi:hypothetical protein
VVDECLKRAKTLYENVVDGQYIHSDMATYNLNAHAIRSHKKKMFKAEDMKDVMMRVKTMYPPIPRSELPSMCVVDKAPDKLISMLRHFPMAAWKVEWMFNGAYDFQMNDLYKMRYFKFRKSDDKRVYMKLWDTMGFAKFDMGYKMWIESLYRPDKIIRYEGRALLLNTQSVHFQIARMMTHIYSFDHIVTLTVITL